MASKAQEQDELLSFIDAIMACIEQYPTFNLETVLKDVNVVITPISLLLNLLGKFVTEEELIEWLAKMLVYTLPEIELAIKGVILSNLKLEISCNIDPWIPSEWRQPCGMDYRWEEDASNPTKIPIPMIDYRGILQINPTSTIGQQYYYNTKLEYTHESHSNPLFTKTSNNYNELYTWVKEKQKDSITGIFYSKDNIKQTGDLVSLYQLARADDMNAFLWFVANKGIYGSLIYEDCDNKDNKADAVTKSNTSHYIDNKTIKLSNIGKNGVYLSGDLVSTEYKIDNKNSIYSSNYLLCYDGQRTYDTEELTYYSKLIPCSNKPNSFNWYVNRKNYYKMIFDGIGKTNYDRNYDNEFPLCNFACVDGSGNPSTNSLQSFIQIKVLPQPMLHYKEAFWLIEKGQTPQPIPFVKILFNEKGEMDKNGSFTVCPEKDINGKVVRNVIKDDNHNIKWITYNLVNPLDGMATDFILIVNGEKYGINSKSNFEKLSTTQQQDPIDFNKVINDCLIACYPGLTIYEFNYDFVMGMKLFNPKNIAIRIIQTLTSFKVGADLSLSMSETLYQMRISEIIKNLIDADDSEVSDCFYSFSNEKYQSMLQDAEKKRANLYPFQDGEQSISIDGEEVISILNEYSSEATLNEQKDIFKRAFAKVTANITNEILPEDRLNISKNFIIESIKVLGVAIFETLISPKMLLLFEVNKRIMGEHSTEYPSIETILQELASLVSSMILELMDTIVKELLSFLMQKLYDLLGKFASMITLEQLNFYRELITKIIKACSFSFPLFGHRANLDTQLDVVQYADIDEIDKPSQTNNC